MSNLELTNNVVNELGISIDLTYSESVDNTYVEQLQSRCEDALNEDNIILDREYVTIDEVDSLEWYIKQNITQFIESKVNINERYETVSINVFFRYDLEDALEDLNEE